VPADAWIPALASVAVVSLISLVGAAAGSRALNRHMVLLALVALAAGSLLGDAVIHLLPDAVERWDGFPLAMSLVLLAGFLLFFVLEVVLRWHHAHSEMGVEPVHAHENEGPRESRVEPFGWINLVGDGLHNFIDGVVIAAAYLISLPLGLATTVAVALHEIPQEFGDFAVLLRAGFTRRRALFYNFLSALTAVAGAVAFLLLPFPADLLERYAIPLTAGGFLYIAAADLVPELHHHTGERRQIAVILAGVVAGLGLMVALLALE
jgi:zinc and cadmium transporter